MQKENLGAKFNDLKVRVELIREGNSHEGPIIKCSQDVVEMMQYLARKDREYFICMHLNAKNMVVGVETVAIGTLDACMVTPREVFKAAIMNNAREVILVHNHVSGNSSASKEDIKITNRLVEAGKIIGIEVLDHIIIAGSNYFSFKDENMI